MAFIFNLRKLFEWELIKSIPDKKKIDFIGVLDDLNDDGYVDLLLPGQKQYALFRGQGGDSFSKASYLPAADVDINASRRNSTATPMDVINGPDIYSNLLVHRLQAESVDKIVYPPILNYTHWIPSVSTGRFNSAELDDFIYLDDIQTETKNTKRVNLIYQSKTGEFPAVPHWQGTVGTDDNVSNTGEFPAVPPWQGTIGTDDNVKMMDFNGDGLIDLFTVRVQRLDNTLSIFLNLGGRFNLNKPDHVMKLKGQLSDFQAIDINRDGFPELVMNALLSSRIKEALSGNVERKLLIFAGRKTEIEGSLFDRKPAFVYKENIDVDNFKSLMGKRSFSDDIDGDGINDVVSVDNTGALVVNRINHDLKLDTEPFLRFAPTHFISNDRLVKLNQDGRTDIILEHNRGLSLIISQQGAQQ